MREQERRGTDAEHREVVRRLSTVLAGGASKGRAGENVLREHLSALPPTMLATDFRVGGKVVEFGLLLPDGRRLPIDSKWTALAELEALEAAADGVDREACARAVEKAVASRAREVAQYLDPALTAPVAVAAVPDAAYERAARAHADAFSHGVVVVPYSTALPIVLFLYALVQRFGDAGRRARRAWPRSARCSTAMEARAGEQVRARGHDARERRRRVAFAARQGARLDRARRARGRRRRPRRCPAEPARRGRCRSCGERVRLRAHGVRGGARALGFRE